MIIHYVRLSLLVLLLIPLMACGDNSSENEDEFDHYSSQEKAIEHYIDDQNVRGSIDLIETTSNDHILVTQYRENTYFVGELKEDSSGFYTGDLSAKVHMETGASWELITIEGDEYSIFFKTEEDVNFKPLSNSDYFVSLIEGHGLDGLSPNQDNAIESIENVKE